MHIHKRDSTWRVTSYLSTGWPGTNWPGTSYLSTGWLETAAERSAFALTAVVLAVLLVTGTFMAVLFAPGFVSAQHGDDVRVTNHLFAERVIQTAEGGYIAQDVIVGFERGTHSFETLTQVVLPKGHHTIEMAIVDPKGAEVERIKFGALQADRDGWTQSLRGTWRNVQFQSDGMHELIVYQNGKTVARFFLTVA